jgi:hypothetical protein
MAHNTCSIDGCDRPHYGHGWCKPHWQRHDRYGDTFPNRPFQAGVPFASPVERFWSRVNRSGGPDSCWPWTKHRDKKGYGRFAYSRDANDRFAHRLAWAFTHGHPGELLVCHRCDNPPCCNPSHLFLGTVADNNADRDAKGRGNRGTKNGQVVLTEAQVCAIRSTYAAGGISQDALGKQYGIDQGHVSRIVNRKLWPHLS